MNQLPPVDQRIVDEYFQLGSQRKTKDVAWLYGMVATYGVKPEELEGFEWGPGFSIVIKDRKRPVDPVHPQWFILFNLHKKQPRESRSRWSPLVSSLYRAMAYQDATLNVTDLLLAHRLRKSHYAAFKRHKASTRSFAGVS